MGGTVSERRKATGQEEVGFYCWGTFPLSLIYFRDVKELHPGWALGFCREYVHEVSVLVEHGDAGRWGLLVSSLTSSQAGGSALSPGALDVWSYLLLPLCSLKLGFEADNLLGLPADQRKRKEGHY